MKSLFILLVFSTSAFARLAPIDSLRNELSQATSIEKRIDILNAMSHAYTQLSLDHAEQLANEALGMALEAGYEKGVATSYNNLGICSSIKGEHTDGMDFFIKALRIREELNDDNGISHVYNNMARVFTYQEDYDRAIEYSQKSLEMLRKMDDPKAVGSAQIALGSIYMNKKDYDQALTMFSAAEEIYIKAGLNGYKCWAQVKSVTALRAQGKYQKALDLGTEVMNSIGVHTDLFSMIELYETFGAIYTNLNMPEKASEYLHKARVLADKGNDSNGRINSTLRLSEMFRAFKNYDSAWYYNDQYITLRNEIFSAEKSRQIATLEQLYESDKKDQLLELRNQRIKALTFIIIVISILLIVIIILGTVLFRYYRDKRKSLEELRRLNREIYEKHEEILTQSEELTQANEEISRMNQSLEIQVSQRVEEVKWQNEKLIEYAYFNAHNVRGPLARILGLSLLMSRETSIQELQDYNSHMYSSAQELDMVIREINFKLTDRNHPFQV